MKKNLLKISLILYTGLLGLLLGYRDPSTLKLGGGTISTLDQFTSTTSPTSAITQRVFGKPIKITGLTTGECLTLDADKILDTVACGSGGVGTSTNPFMATYFVATSTTATSSLPRLSVSTGISLMGEYFENFTTYVRTLFTGGTGVAVSSGDISFDCSEVEGTGINCSGENITLDATGNWTGTLDGSEGASLLDRANHTGTQLAATISNFVATVRTSISETITGIDYDNTTGVLSLTSGFNIPLTASTTNWNSFYDTPSTRVTAGTNLSWSGNTLNASGGSGAPAGSMLMWASSTPPSGYLLADGSAVSRTTYSDLFTAIGTAYGSGDGSTTFNVPNLKGNVAVGLDAAQTEFDALAETGGAKTHTLTEAQLPSHTHGLYTDSGSGGPNGGQYALSAGNGTFFTSTAATGSGQPHNNLQPYVVVNYIIKY